MFRLPEDDAGALKHVGLLTIYKILFINICCAFVALVNKPILEFTFAILY
jgi:hypothetical protein